MDSLERLVRALNFEEPDRVPTFDSVRSPAIIRELGGTGPAEEVIPRAHKALGLDSGIASIGARRELSLAEILAEEATERVWKSRRWGFLACEKPFTFRWDPQTQTTWFIDRPFKNLDDIADIEIEPLPEDEIMEECVETLMRSKSAYEKHGVVFIAYGGCSVLESAYRMLGWSLFIQVMYRARHLLRKLMEKASIAAVVCARVYSEANIGPAYIYGDDIAWNKGLFFNPEFLRKDWLPIVRKIIQPVRKAGIKPIYHSEGNTELMLNDLISAGFEGLYPVEYRSMDIGEIKEKYGDSMVLFGGVDNHYLLQHGSPSAIERQAKESIEKAAYGSGFVLSTDEINPETPTANAIAAYKTARKYGVYPLRA